MVDNFYFFSVDPTMQSTRVSFSPRKMRVMLSSRMSTARRNAGVKHEVLWRMLLLIPSSRYDEIQVIRVLFIL